MGVIRDFKATTVTGFLKQHVAADSTLYTDGLKSFTGLEGRGFGTSPGRNPCAVT